MAQTVLGSQQSQFIDKSCERSVGDTETGADHSKDPEDQKVTSSRIETVTAEAGFETLESTKIVNVAPSG